MNTTRLALSNFGTVAEKLDGGDLEPYTLIYIQGSINI